MPNVSSEGSTLNNDETGEFRPVFDSGGRKRCCRCKETILAYGDNLCPRCRKVWEKD
jgi:hypothetical protein